MNLPFEIVYADRDGKEYICRDWNRGAAGQYPVWNCPCAPEGVTVSVRDDLDGSFIIKVFNFGKKPAVGWWGVRRKWHWSEEAYTLVPGVFYNGNRQEKLRGIPVLHMPESPVYQLPFSAAAMPAVFAGRTPGGENGFCWRVSPMSSAGWNGVEFNAAAETMTIWMPAKEDRVYRYGTPEDYGREPWVLQPMSAISLKLHTGVLDAAAPAEIFEACWQAREDFAPMTMPSPGKLGIDEAARLVGGWVMKKHFVRGSHNEPMLLNAFMDINRENTPVADLAEWNVMIGWCSGTMTALPLLALDERSGQAAAEYVDFLCSDGFFANGLKKPIFDGTRWIETDERPEYSVYEHVRLYGDFAWWLGRCIRLEKRRGRKHEQWGKVFADQIGIFADIWRRCHDFGLYWTTGSDEITPRRGGTAAGAFVFAALSEALFHFPEDRTLRTILPEIADLYAERVLKTGRSNGGPLDILEADDSESIAALTDACCNLYERTLDGRFLEYALDAAKIFASWVLAYRPPFPPASSLEGLDLTGGVIANVQNRHIGPGICTNSGVFLRKLARWTGDDRWEVLYRQIGKAATECVSMDEKEFPGVYGGEMRPFAAGMVSEQMNVADSAHFSGESWRVSACWPATAVLLYWLDSKDSAGETDSE